MNNKKILGYVFGIIGIILGIILNILFPLNNEHIFFIIQKENITINLFPISLLFSGSLCFILSIILINDKKRN